MEEEIDKPLAVDVDIDPDFEPQKGPGPCTWPLPRPESNDGKAEPADVGIIPEEEVDELGSDDACASSAITGASKPVSVTEGNQAAAPAIETSAAVSDQDSYGSPLSSQRALPACNDSSINGLIPQQSRKSSARRNAWGNYSYAGPHHSSHRELAWEATDIGPGLWLDGPECAILQGQRWQQQLCWMEGTSGQRRASF